VPLEISRLVLEGVSNSKDGFELLGLTRKTLKGIQEAGYESPTPVQGQAIPILMSGADLIAEAQTGTGKTAAFALPILERLQPGKKSPQALILCPTRELALQVSEAIYGLGRTPEARVLPVYGGQPIERQLRALRDGVSIVVGTPGRLLDHIRRKTLKLDGVSMVVVDEADEMLAMGFIDDVQLIFDQLPANRQIALFSATMPRPIVQLAGKYLRNAQKVTIASKPHTIPQIRQSYYEVSRPQKVDALTRILDMETPGPTIIFCNTKREVDMLSDHLRGRGYQADTLHGDLTQPGRDKVMRRFREGQVDILVATDVAARGLDIKSVTHVVNYDVPWDAESYTHRIGRTGRAGREGDAITLVSARELRQLKAIEKSTRAKIRPVRLPSVADIAVRRREVFKQSVIGTLEEGAFEEFLVTVDELTENYQPAEIAAAALKLLWAQQKAGTSSQPEAAAKGGPVQTVKPKKRH
jgi:ATP-dependent RNA helicase DeaD